MNIDSFFSHYGVRENPFRAEEARQDAVFDRLGAGKTAHPDFEKILGDLADPSTSIVFGEKGSGKTAIRLQMAMRIGAYNTEHADHKAFLLPYDDLNPLLDRFQAATGGDQDRRSKKRSRIKPKSKSPDETLELLERLRLRDHFDGILHVGVSRLVDALLGDPRADSSLALDHRALKGLRKSNPDTRADMMLLQALYDRPSHAQDRTALLRRRIRAPRAGDALVWGALVWVGCMLPIGVLIFWWKWGEAKPNWPWPEALVAALALCAAFLLKRFVWDRIRRLRLGKKLSSRLRVMHRDPASFAASLAYVPVRRRSRADMPLENSSESRIAQLERFQRVLERLGYANIVVVLDRIDEPTLVSGDPERMRAIIWPMLNSKFLQQEHVGFKLLLPIELRHSLFRESSAFFQEARLDKQNLIDRLTWTGATLYDLCNARLRACMADQSDEAQSKFGLAQLFDDDVSRQDIVDALNQMHQPRDAFKFMYQCIQEHCSNVTEEQAAWKIPRLILETVRKQQADRVQELYRGVRPA